MTTQGAATHQRNNHPFLGKLPHTQFALAHNGILTNDRQLHLKEQLPRTEIETESYVAVQLLEQEKSLDFTSLRNMAEKVQGTFTFTVMDQKNRLYIAKGNNPLCLYYFTAGFYLYASTKEILETALEAMGYLELPHEEIPISNGEILKIAPNGQRSSAWFQPPASMHYYMPFYDDAWEDVWYSMEQKEPEGYRKFLMEYSQSFGIPESQMQYLHQSGLSDLDLEECIWDLSFRSFWLSELGYYDEMEDYDEYGSQFGISLRIDVNSPPRRGLGQKICLNSIWNTARKQRLKRFPSINSPDVCILYQPCKQENFSVTVFSSKVSLELD